MGYYKHRTKKRKVFCSERFLILKEKLKHRLLLSNFYNLYHFKVQTFQFYTYTHTYMCVYEILQGSIKEKREIHHYFVSICHRIKVPLPFNGHFHPYVFFVVVYFLFFFLYFNPTRNKWQYKLASWHNSSKTDISLYVLFFCWYKYDNALID